MRWGAMLALVLWSYVAMAEALGPDGFPLDWTVRDFDVSSVSESTVPVKGGVVSMPVSALPRVSADPSMTPVLASTTVQVSLTKPMPQLPTVQVEDVGKIPEELAKLDMWGPLTEMSGGISEKAWSGVKAAEVLALVDGLAPKPLASDAVRDLLARTLLTRGRMDGEATVAGGLLAARAKALQGIGLDEQAYALWRVVPASVRGEDGVLTRGWAASSLMAGQAVEPCAVARKLVVASPQGFWREMAVTCTALDRVSGGLDLSLAVADEQGLGNFDPVLWKLLVALRDDDVPVKLKAKEAVSPLSAALVAAYPSLLEMKELGRLPNVVLRRLLQTPALPLVLRLEAAELLQVRMPSAVGAEAVRVLYEAYPFPPDQVQMAPALAKSLKGGEARALLWQAARMMPQLADKAVAWGLFAAQAEKDGREALAVWLPASRAEIAASPETFAALGEAWPQAVRGAWLLGDDKAALAWRVAAQDVVSATVPLIRTRAQLGVEAAVADGRLADTALEQWLVTQSMADAAGRTAAVRGLAVLEGLGIELPDDAWTRLEAMLALRDDSFGGDMVRVQALNVLAEAKRPGPVVLKVAQWAQARPLRAWAPLEAKAAVAALQAVGLTREAKLLAWEILAAPAEGVVIRAEAERKEEGAVDATPVKAGGVRMQNMPRSTAPQETPLLPPPEGM